MSKTTIWIVAVLFVIFLLFAWSAKLQKQDPDILSTHGIHWHPQIHIFIDGKEQPLTENIGIGATHNPIHTHDDVGDGTVHLEFEGRVSKDDVQLQDFFNVWGKDINSFGQLTRMTVNGKENKEFGAYIMHDDDVINLYYKSNYKN